MSKVQSKTEQVVERISKLILEGELKPDSLFPAEDTLCKQLSVSRSILREAMKILSARGLVHIKQGYGTTVRAPGEELTEEALGTFLQLNSISLLQLMEVRAPLEIDIARYAAIRRTEKNLESIRNAMHGMEKNLYNQEKFVKEDNNFHQALVDSTHNSVFGIITRSIIPLLNVCQTITMKYGLNKAIKEHQAILTAIERKDSETAQKAMKKNMESTELHIRKYLKEP